jgi:hypothetical protein
MHSRACSLCVICLWLAGCEVPERPGELVGRYDVTGALVRNECGASALPINDPLSFEVEIRDDQGTGIWYLAEPPSISGALGADGAFHFTHNQRAEVEAPGTRTVTDPDDPNDFLAPEPDIEVNVAGCQMGIVESIDGALFRDSRGDGGIGAPGAVESGDGEVFADLTATNMIEVSVMPGSDCKKSLAANGGPFLALPCVAEYQLTGTLLEQ